MSARVIIAVAPPLLGPQANRQQAVASGTDLGIVSLNSGLPSSRPRQRNHSNCGYPPREWQKMTAKRPPGTDEAAMAELFELTSDLIAARDEQEAAMFLAEHIAVLYHGETVVLLADPAGSLAVKGRSAISFEPTAATLAAARAAFERNELTDDGAGVLCFPIAISGESFGVLLVKNPVAPLRDNGFRRLINAAISQTIRAITRVRCVDAAWTAALRAADVSMRNALLSSVSHDLRTPLAVITGAATVLRNNLDLLSSDQRAALLDAVCLESERMERMVGNVLEVANIESRSQALNREWLPLEEIVGAALTRLERALRARDITLRLEPDLPLISADPVLLEVALVNLLDNALKYTPPNSPIQLEATVRQQELTLTVADRGPGIPAGSEDQVFDKYFRGAHPGISGIGMGLPLCRLIVHAHGGTLTAKNRPGGGALFCIILPVDQPPAGAPELPLDEE